MTWIGILLGIFAVIIIGIIAVVYLVVKDKDVYDESITDVMKRF